MDPEESSSSTPQVPKLEPVHVVYCGVTKLPAEYAEFSDKYTESIEWFKKNHPELLHVVAPQVASASGETGLEQKVGEVAVSEKKPKKKKKEVENKVTLQSATRGGKKHITVIVGLELFGVDLKKASKAFATKFACGSAVSKTPAGGQEIIIQGDFVDDLVDFIPETWDTISEDNIDILEEKKK